MFKWILIFSLFCVISTHVEAQQGHSCGDRLRVIDILDKKYGESRQSFGLGTNQYLVEIFASRETGTWTIIETAPNGRTCILAAGESFERMRDSFAAVSGEIL